MNARLGRVLLAGFLGSLLVAAPSTAFAQANAESRAPVDPSQLVVQSYAPTIFGADEVRIAADQLFGQQLLVAQTKTDANGFQTGFSTVPHFVVLGDLLLVRDTLEQGQRIVQTLRDLEAVEIKRRRDAEDANEVRRSAKRNPGADGEDKVPYETAELRPKYVPFQTLFDALKPFQRELPAGREGEAAPWNVLGMERSNVILLRETPKRLAELQEFVARIDRPRPQVTFHATLARATRSSGGSKLPEDLTRHLQSLLPGQNFELISISMLRCSLQSGQECMLETKLDGGDSWKLSFCPDAYDPDSGQISLTRCRFRLESPRPNSQPPATQQFETSLTITPGEHLALGAVGDEPIFVVLRVDPVGQPR